MTPEKPNSSVADFDVVPFSAERRREVVELLNICLPPKTTGDRTGRYWAWKHEENPFGPSLLLLAECDGRIVGVRAFMRWRLRCGGETFDVAKPVDTVTHPDYQRRGIFTKLTLAAIEQAGQRGVRFLFNTPNANSAPGYLKLGWKEVDRLPLYAKPLRPIVGAWNAVRWQLRKHDAPPTEEFFRSTPRPADEVLGNEAAINGLTRSEQRTAHFATEHTMDYLRWRYCRHPNIPYFAETVGSTGQVDGCLFYRVNFRKGLREVMVDDVLLRTTDRELFRQLIGQLRRRVRADYLVAHASSTTSLLDSLRSLGFCKVPRRRITLVARTLKEDIQPDPFDSGNWSLCLGDMEGL